MSVYQNVSFAINQYDSDGDIADECILLYLDATILKLSGVKQLDVFIENLQLISKEIKEHY